VKKININTVYCLFHVSIGEHNSLHIFGDSRALLSDINCPAFEKTRLLGTDVATMQKSRSYSTHNQIDPKKIANGSKVTAALSRIHVPGRAPCSARQIPLKALINDNQMHSIVRPCSATGSGKPPGERQGSKGQGRVFSAGGKPGCRNWRITPTRSHGVRRRAMRGPIPDYQCQSHSSRVKLQIRRLLTVLSPQ